MLFAMEPVKTAILDFHVQIDGQLEDIIILQFRDPKAFEVNGFAAKASVLACRSCSAATTHRGALISSSWHKSQIRRYL
jgi:hypothetical protein